MGDLWQTLIKDIVLTGFGGWVLYVQSSMAHPSPELLTVAVLLLTGTGAGHVRALVSRPTGAQSSPAPLPESPPRSSSPGGQADGDE